MKLRTLPSFAISAVVNRPVEKTMVLGAVATGSMNAQLALMAAGTIKRAGSISAAIAAAAREELHVIRGAMRTFNLMEKPGTFLKDRRTQLTILRYMFKGRRKNAEARYQQGPSREEMISLITPTSTVSTTCLLNSRQTAAPLTSIKSVKRGDEPFSPSQAPRIKPTVAQGSGPPGWTTQTRRGQRRQTSMAFVGTSPIRPAVLFQPTGSWFGLPLFGT